MKELKRTKIVRTISLSIMGYVVRYVERTSEYNRAVYAAWIELHTKNEHTHKWYDGFVGWFDKYENADAEIATIMEGGLKQLSFTPCIKFFINDGLCPPISQNPYERIDTMLNTKEHVDLDSIITAAYPTPEHMQKTYQEEDPKFGTVED